MKLPEAMRGSSPNVLLPRPLVKSLSERLRQRCCGSNLLNSENLVLEIHALFMVGFFSLLARFRPNPNNLLLL